MKELKFLELQEVTMQEVISYSKLETASIVTILNSINYGLFNEIVALADELKLVFFIIKDTDKIAFIGNHNVALKIARVMKVKAQVMYFSLLKPRKILGKIYTPKRNTNYVVRAIGENGKEIEPFIDTEIETVECTTLSKYRFSPYKYCMRVRGSGNNKIESYQQLRDKRKHFILTGKI